MASSDLLGAPDIAPVIPIASGGVTVTVAPRAARLLVPKERDLGGCSRYEGVD